MLLITSASVLKEWTLLTGNVNVVEMRSLLEDSVNAGKGMAELMGSADPAVPLLSPARFRRSVCAWGTTKEMGLTANFQEQKRVIFPMPSLAPSRVEVE